MAKNKIKRKRSNIIHDGVSIKRSKTPTIATPPPDSDSIEPKAFQSLGLHQDDLEIAVDTLNTLAANPSVIKSKGCKDLRAAVYEFRQACTTGLNASVDSNITSRITGALADGGYEEARILLAEMRIRKQTPKLGALCRWVRHLDVVSGFAQQIEGRVRRTENQEQVLMVLDTILRLTGPIDYSIDGKLAASPILLRKAWDLRDGKERSMVYNSVLDRTILQNFPVEKKSDFKIIETIPGLQRKPANHHPAILYASKDDTIILSHTPRTTHQMHPAVPNLHFLKDVLSTYECNQIIAAGESLGFTPDAPICAPEDSSILAHNFYWIVDTAFINQLWRRVEIFVPANVGGKKVRGLNRRFRVYRYIPGAQYRAHIDGAWPPSGVDLTNDTYIYDSSPPDARQSSLFTFLIYLNDEFEGGETTFFLPSAIEGSMNAYPVKPIQGSLIMFPHGETEGSLLHEGTGVRQGVTPSAKYVIRTDAIYDT